MTAAHPGHGMTPRLISLALCSALIAVAGSARPTGVTTERANGVAWDSVVVPGGFAGVQHAVSMQGPVEDWRTIPLIIELSYRGLEGLRVTRQLETYSATLRTLRRLAEAVSPDRTITLEKGSARRAEFERLLDALGLEYGPDQRTVGVKPGADGQLRTEILAAGLPSRDIVERLNAGGGVSLATRDSVAPLPLGAAFWERRFEPVPPEYDLLWAILASREMSSLYYGLLGFDGPSLQAVAADAKLESALVEYALIVPTVAHALRIADGRVQTPGGADAVHLWQDLVGKTVDRPADFVKALLGQDQGQLAYFYGSLAALPPNTAGWVMGHPAVDGNARRKAFKRLYEAFQSALGGWRPNALLQAPRYTPSEVLLALTTTDSGTLAGPAWPEFWGRAFASDAWPTNPARAVEGIDTSRAVDAAAILELVCPRECDPVRLGTLVLLQRDFPTASPSDAAGLLSAARVRARYPVLALEIGRMKLGDTDAYRQLGGIAAKIEGLESSVEAVALVQFQAVVSMLARIRAMGAPAEWIREQVGSLATVPVGSSGFDGGLVRWLDTRLLAASAGEQPHDAAVRVLSGDGWQKPGGTFEWEGLRYRVDVAASERERIEEVRRSLSANTLTSAVGLLRLADDLPEAVTSGRLDAFERTLEEITGSLDDIGAVGWSGSPSTFGGLRDLSGEVIGTLRSARAQDYGRLQRAARTLRHAADIVAADALIALVYACSLQDSTNPLAMSRELPRRHHLRTARTSAQKWGPWSLPFERYSEGDARHVAGALLGLDAGVPQLFVRQISTRRPEQEPNLGATIAEALWRTASLAAPWNMSDEDIASIDDARKRGVAKAEGWRREFEEGTLDEAGIVGPRAGWLRWSAERGAIQIDVLHLEDLVRLGSDTHVLASAWGAGGDASSCLCVAMPRVAGEMRGPALDTNAAVLAIVELSLRVAQELRARGVPAPLAPGVLMLFTTELIDHALVPYPVDVGSISHLVRGVPSRRFDDYVAAVAARGPLVPIEEVDR